jgi:hypothetical protein
VGARLPALNLPALNLPALNLPAINLPGCLSAPEFSTRRSTCCFTFPSSRGSWHRNTGKCSLDPRLGISGAAERHDSADA